LYPRLIKANLDLYATTYWLTENYQQDVPSPHYLAEIDQVFTALIDAQKDTVACTIPGNPAKADPNNAEGLCSCMILNQTKLQWDLFSQQFTNGLK
jgi:hypothetical protein